MEIIRKPETRGISNRTTKITETIILPVHN